MSSGTTAPGSGRRHFDSQAPSALGDTLRAVAPVIPDPRRIKTFADEAAFETWLAAHHDREPEVWIKVHKKASGLASVTTAQALDVVLCWGWIDGIRKGFDERSSTALHAAPGEEHLESDQPRACRALVAAGRMTPHGQRQVDAAKADGRWAAAYAPMRETGWTSNLPSRSASRDPRQPARDGRRLVPLGRQNLYALAFRTTT